MNQVVLGVGKARHSGYRWVADQMPEEAPIWLRPPSKDPGEKFVRNADVDLF